MILSLDRRTLHSFVSLLSRLKKLDSFPPKLPSLVQDYFDGKEAISNLVNLPPTYKALRDNHDTVVERKIDREVLVQVLLSQAKKSEYSNEVTNNQINSLSHSNISTITTGHQLSIYGGPMFFFYKILSIVSIAEKLKKDGKKSIPIYWMASEDHDFDEINHIVVEGQKAHWETDQNGPVGRMKLNNFSSFKNQIVEQLKDDYRYSKTLKELDRIFDSRKTLTDAIRDFVYWIFADSGVVVIDADDRNLKRLFIPYLEKELATNFSQKAIDDNSLQLGTLGYKTQVAGREINLFWMRDGYRDRIVKTVDGFATADRKYQWDYETMLSLVKASPECFSPNVILRPLYQEGILPNIAYVGGPGETSYWLQLKGVFDSASIPMPLVLLRDMFSLMNPLSIKKKDQLGINWVDLYQNQDDLVKRLIRMKGSHEELVSKRQVLLEDSFKLMANELSEFDDSLRRKTEAELVRLNRKLETLKKKVLRSEKNQNEVLLKRVEHLYLQSFPVGNPQERVLNWLHFWPLPKSVLELLPHCDPFSTEIKVIETD